MDAPCTIEKDEGLTLSSQNPLTIEFDHVSFSYPFSGKLVLNDVSMCFNAGTKTAIVGHNGAGKSTIIKLLLRFYDVDSGEIRINGTNIKEYNVSELRKSIGTVLQDSPVYAMPIVDFLLSLQVYGCRGRKASSRYSCSHRAFKQDSRTEDLCGRNEHADNEGI